MYKEQLKEKIKLTGYLNNVKVGRNFTKQYPELNITVIKLNVRNVKNV
jgi:hypothetical protein